VSSATAKSAEAAAGVPASSAPIALSNPVASTTAVAHAQQTSTKNSPAAPASVMASATPRISPQPAPASKSSTSELGRDVPILVKVDNSKPFYLEPGFFSAIGALLSLFAIGLSIYTTISTSRKDSVARRQSINDEFWLRKVLFPTSIEPILKLFFDTIHTLPRDRSDPLATNAAVAEFKAKFDTEHANLSSKLLSVAILKQSLYIDLSQEFEKVQDAVANYCFENKDGYNIENPDSISTRASVSTKLSDLQINMLRYIKTVQEDIK
jgi:hypothetical protein